MIDERRMFQQIAEARVACPNRGAFTCQQQAAQRLFRGR